MNQTLPYEMKSIQPLRCANVVGLVYGLLILPWTLLILPVFLILPLGDYGSAEDMIAKGFVAVMVLFYPVMGFVFGWIGGLLFAAIYNLVVRWIGGFRLRLAVVPDESGAPAQISAPQP